MDLYMIVFRLLHIIAGIYWVGAGLMLSLFMLPIIKKGGAAGRDFFGMMHEKTAFGISFPLSSLLTSIAGLFLYVRVSGMVGGVEGQVGDWFQDFGNVVLTIGVVAGLAAFGHGAMALGKYTRGFVQAYKAGGANPTTEQIQAIDAMTAKLDTNARISLIMMLISTFCMISARYI